MTMLWVAVVLALVLPLAVLGYGLWITRGVTGPRVSS